MKCVYIDVETGGVDPRTCAMLQIAMVVEIHGDVQEKYESKIAPFPDDEIYDKALEVNNFTKEQIKEFPPPGEVYGAITDIFKRYVNRYSKQDKFFFIGYNSHAFDMPFVRKFFEKNNDKYFGSWFFYPSIDIMILAAQSLRTQRNQMLNFKLGTVAQALGVSPDPTKLHDALYDIELTREVYKRL
jgi:DNA polymerase-3 subunit epsilon